jgi:hypothetical protein
MRATARLALDDAAQGAALTLSFRPRRMARIVAVMLDLGMAVDAGPPPKFPLWAVYGVSDFDRLGRPVGGRAREYERVLAGILSWHGDTLREGIPAHKLRTTLGWHVTADECAAALRRYDDWCAGGTVPPAVFGPDLIPFLRAATHQDGFEVH